MSLFSSTSDFAKEIWLPTFTNQLSEAQGTFLNLFGLTPDERVQVEGRKAHMKVKVGSDKGFGMVGQGGDFPDPGDITADEATLELTRFSNTIQFDADEMEKLDSLTAAAAPIMEEKMQSARDSVLFHIERQAIMDGSGALAKVASVSSPDITLDVAGSDYSERNPFTWIDDPHRSRYLLIDPTSGADQLSGSFSITEVNESTNTVTTDTTTTSGAAGDLIVVDHPVGWASGGSLVSPEFEGLLAMIDDSGTYLNIARGSVPQWSSTVLDNSGTLRDLSESLTLELMAKAARRSKMGSLSPDEYCAVASPGVWNAYHLLMSSGLRYTTSETPDIGWGGKPFLNMHGIPLYQHVNAPRHQILLTRKKSIGFVGAKHGTNSIVKFVEQGGSIFHRKNASSGQGYADAVLAMIAGFIGMYTDRPRDHARLDDLNETAGAY